MVDVGAKEITSRTASARSVVTLPPEARNIDISIRDNNEVIITSSVSVSAKTGVEMEALMATSIAALTVYDMCKSIGHEIVISRTELISKTGGKSDYEKT